MPTASPDVSRFEQLARQRRIEEALRTLQAPGWEQRLGPLAQHMAAQRLVRAPGHAGAAVRQLDLTLLREALTRLLWHDPDQAHLVIQLVALGAEPATVAAERGVSRYVLVEQLRDAVGALATRYERLAAGDLNEGSAPNVRTALGGKRR